MNKLLLDIPKKISTSQLTLMMPQAGDGALLHQAIMDGYEDYVQWLNWPEKPPTIEEVEIDCRKHHADFILRECIRYLILDNTTNEILGRCAFPPHQVNWQIPQFGISYFIRQSQRARGFASTAAHMMAIVAFRYLHAKKVDIFCDTENIASTKIPLKLGFSLEYVQRGGWPRKDGQLAKLQTYAVFSEAELPPLTLIDR